MNRQCEASPGKCPIALGSRNGVPIRDTHISIGSERSRSWNGPCHCKPVVPMRPPCLRTNAGWFRRLRYGAREDDTWNLRAYRLWGM